MIRATMTPEPDDYSDSVLDCRIPDSYRGRRLDQALAELFPEYSRSALQQWIREQRVQVDGEIPRPRNKLLGGERVLLRPAPIAEIEAKPQPIDFHIVYEDAQILVIDKPAGLVMHPAAGNADGTVQNGLLYFDKKLAELPRAGIVHRLDKDTTGLFVVARTLAAHTSLVAQLQAREVHREYRAIASGVLVAGGSVDEPIGRHPRDRKRMAVVAGGKPAITHFRVLEKFRAHSYLKLQLETGRTHQIRVHMAYRQHPLVGDPMYAGRLHIPAGTGSELAAGLRSFSRQALHAARLSLAHPTSGESMEWQSPIPADMRELLTLLREGS